MRPAELARPNASIETDRRWTAWQETQDDDWDAAEELDIFYEYGSTAFHFTLPFEQREEPKNQKSHKEVILSVITIAVTSLIGFGLSRGSREVWLGAAALSLLCLLLMAIVVMRDSYSSSE